MISMKDIADAAGVSITTVSFVLNGKGNISPETRDRVLQVVKEKGYTRSIHARNLRDNQARIIGYAQHRSRGQYHPLLDQFLYHLVQLVEPEGRHVLLFHAEPDDPVSVYRNLINSRRVDGFVLSYTERDDERFQVLHQEMEFPFVAFGQSLSPLDSVTHWVDVDGHTGIAMATTHLIERGHRRIAMIAWPEGSASGDLRFAGYVDTLQAHGIAYDDTLVTRIEDSIGNGYQVAQALMSLPDPPTAVVAVTDSFAFGAMQYCKDAGEVIAVTGFDDTPMAELLSLTSIRQPVEHVAELLVEMLLAQLDDIEVETKQHLLKPELIIRTSSA